MAKLLDTERAFREARRASVIGSSVAGGIDLITKTILKHLENKRLSSEARQRWRDQLRIFQAKHGFTLAEQEAEHRNILEQIAAKGKFATQTARLRAERQFKTDKDAKRKLNTIANFREWFSVEDAKRGKGLFYDENGQKRVDPVTGKPYVDDAGKPTAMARKAHLDVLSNFIEVHKGTLDRFARDKLLRAANKAVNDFKLDTDLQAWTTGMTALSVAKGEDDDTDIRSLINVADFIGRGGEIYNILQIQTQQADVKTKKENIQALLPTGFTVSQEDKKRELARIFMEQRGSADPNTLEAFKRAFNEARMTDKEVKQKIEEQKIFESQIRSQVEEQKVKEALAGGSQFLPPQAGVPQLITTPKITEAVLAGVRKPNLIKRTNR
jgi:hypothetical protein